MGWPDMITSGQGVHAHSVQLVEGGAGDLVLPMVMHACGIRSLVCMCSMPEAGLLGPVIDLSESRRLATYKIGI